MKIYFIENNIKISRDVNSIDDLCEVCKSPQNFEPPLEDQLRSEYPYTINGKPESHTFSCEVDGKMECGEINSLSALVAIVKSLGENPSSKFFPDLSVQLAECGGWDSERIRDYARFVKDVQNELPEDYRIEIVRKKVDLFLKFWYAEEQNYFTTRFIDHLVDLKKTIMR